MAQVINVRLNKGEAPSLGFRLQGGKDFGTPLIIQKVNIGSPAEKSGLYAGDAVVKINNTDVFNLRHKDAQDVIIRAGPAFEITVQRGGSTWKPSVTPVTATVPKPQPASNSYTPVTKTSLAASPQPSIGAIGTGHNVSAKPFAGQLNGNVNGGPKLVNKQYNSPVGLYSEQSIAETLSAQTEVLATGVLGVNFKKNEKNYDASNSAVFRMVQEADKEPRDAEPVNRQNYYSTHSHAIGGRSATPRSITPLSERSYSRQGVETTPKSNPYDQGMTKCSECDRVIVGVFVRIKDKNLHVECFKCATCGTSLKNVGYYNINNKLYCDIHAKLAARGNAPAGNLVPVTVPPGGRAPAGTISAALSGHSLPSSAAPLSPSTNFTPQPFQLDVTNQVPQTELDCMTITEPVESQNSITKTTITEPEPQNSIKTVPTINGSKIENRSGPVPFSAYLSKATPNFSSPRPFSSVSAPLSPPASQGYSTLPRAAPPSAPFSSPAPSIPSSEKGRSIQNIIWPPPPDPEEPDIPTATPLYFPPPTHIRVPSPPFKPIPPPPHKPVTPRDWRKETVTEQKETKEETVHTETTVTKEITTEETEEVIKPSMDPRMSMCSSEVVSIVDRKIAIEKIESAAETQMLIESVMKQRPMSPPPIPPLNQNAHPKVEVQTKPISGVLTNQQEPRVVTRVCVCTNSCCNAATGELCESCPMRELKRPADYNKPKIHPVENSVPKRYGSPIITGVSVTINNPGKIKESRDPFTQIPMKRTTTALGSALVTAPKEPFHSITSQLTSEHVDLPEETDPYLPPERPIVPVERKEKPEPAPQPDTPFIQALRIAPARPFTPTNLPEPVYKKKPKEDPVLKDLPKPIQWMSMRTALTTASDRPYSPLVTEISSTTKQTSHTEMQMEEITNIKETQQQILKRSGHNETALPYVGTTTKPVKLEKFDPVNDDRVTPQMHFPPISDELKSSYEYHADYSDIKSEISSQIVEQAHLEETSEVCTKTQEQKVTQCSSCKKAMSEMKEERKIERQTEETILKKPMELTSYLHKAEYLPQYQMSLNYDETIQLPHHKDIKKLLQADQSKQDTRHTTSKPMTTYYPPKHLTDPQSVPTIQPAITKPVSTIQQVTRTPNNIAQMSFQTINDEKPQRTSFSPRPGSLTPSMINKPAPTLPYYQENLIYTPQDVPEVNVFDPKSPAISRSPSPCPDRARSPSPFGRMSPRPRSPAPGPPPNPLKQGIVPKFTKEDRLRDEAKKNICSYIPHHMERLDVEKSMQSVTLEIPTQSSYASSESSERRHQGGITEDVCSKKSAYQTQSGHQTQSAGYERSCVANGMMQESKQSQQMCQRSQECKKSEQMCKKSQECKTSEQMCQRSQAQTSQSIQQSTQRSSHQSMQQSTHQTVQQTSHQSLQESARQSMQQSSQSSSQQSHPFKQVRNPEVEPPGVLGMRVTNPQPLHSPFLMKDQPQPPQPVPPPPPKRTSIPVTQFSANTAQPNQSKPVNLGSLTNKPGPGVSSNKPTIPPPNAGTGGGRQAGAVGFSPKRGKGVLNVGGLIGSRVPVCGHCHGQIRGPFISALGKIWCPDHFTCNTQSCRRPLQDLGFVEDQNGLFCEYCFEQYLAPPCSKCGSKIKGDCLKAIGKNFHPECFNCSYCGKLFSNSPFFLEDGQPYCENDWNELFTTKCFACGFPVEAGDRWLEALNNNYHSQCFNCTSCKKNLEGQKFFAKGGRPYCNNHAR